MCKFLTLGNGGWCDVHIGDYTSRASYISDVPIDCLRAALAHISHGNELILYFDAEGWRFEIESDHEKTVVHYTNTMRSGGEKMVVRDVTAIDLCHMILDDISSDIAGWLEFLFVCNEADKMRASYTLCTLVSKLRRAIERYDQGERK